RMGGLHLMTASRARLQPCARAAACLLAPALLLGPADAQATAVCSDTPGAGEWIACSEDSTSTRDIDIDADGVDMDPTGEQESGVSAEHGGSGNIDINISGSTAGGVTTASTIDIGTTGRLADGIFANHFGTAGTITITVEDTEITTTVGHSTSAGGTGISALNRARGNLVIDLNPGTVIDAAGYGVVADHQNKAASDADYGGSDVVLTADGVAVMSGGIGFWARRESGPGDVTIDVRDSTVTMKGNIHAAVYGYRYTDTGDDGDVTITLTNGSTTTEGYTAHGVLGDQQVDQNRDAEGDITIILVNHAIETRGTDMAPQLPGTYSYGIFAVHESTGNIHIDMRAGSSVTTRGRNSHGIVAYHYGTADARRIDITVGGTVTTEGAEAQGVRVGSMGSNGPARMAALDDEGYRMQAVTVDSGISSQGEGVYLVNGGRVVIGPRGSIRSASGIAILATGTVPEDGTDPGNAIPAIPPKLRVDLNLGGRRVSQALGGGWILNDGGETTIFMNGVELHNGAMGATGNTARNGAWNIRMRPDGVRVTDRTDSDPAMWVVSERAEGVIADRDFSAADFTEERRPPGEDIGGVLAASCGQPEIRKNPASLFVETFAPRAAVYEALPAILLNLNDAGQETGTPPPDRHSFARTLAKSGGHGPECSTVGQRHRFEYAGVQAGRHLELAEGLEASVALHRVWSTIDVTAGTGGGEIGVEATGLVLGGSWSGPDGYYAKGSLSATHYRFGAWSQDEAVGRLASEVGARGSLARFEAGRRMDPGTGLELEPRIWVERSTLSADGFTDATGSRVSVAGTARVTGGVGMTVRSEHRAGTGRMALRGSVDLAHVFGGRTAVVDVSGSRLVSEANGTEMRLGLAGIYRQDRWSLAVEASVNGSDPDDARGAGGVRLTVWF
ncbi:MAG: autotransporter outer membrane beta-barrel domain-containing protein, partial [Gammaproteobacteria bacterium]|nr:autotransporter outer membrane beta-barrel domain-containing protein [Gammaproteobacteria bacterium]